VEYLENLAGSMKHLMRCLCLVETPLTVSLYAAIRRGISRRFTTAFRPITMSGHRSLSNNYFDEGEQDEHWKASTSGAEG
jgi:hypothetical protein